MDEQGKIADPPGLAPVEKRCQRSGIFRPAPMAADPRHDMGVIFDPGCMEPLYGQFRLCKGVPLFLLAQHILQPALDAQIEIRKLPLLQRCKLLVGFTEDVFYMGVHAHRSQPGESLAAPAQNGGQLGRGQGKGVAVAEKDPLRIAAQGSDSIDLRLHEL